MKFVSVKPCIDACLLVGNQLVLDIIQCYQHPGFFKVGAEIPHIKHNEAIAHIHIGGVCKEVHRTEYIHLQRQCQVLGLRLIDLFDDIVELPEGRHILRSVSAGNIGLINLPQGAVHQ